MNNITITEYKKRYCNYKYKGMTAADILVKHRELWLWLAEHPGLHKGDWPGWKQFYSEPANQCFACEYTIQHSQVICALGDFVCDRTEGINCLNGLYTQWSLGSDKLCNVEVARQIANLHVSNWVWAKEQKQPRNLCVVLGQLCSICRNQNLLPYLQKLQSDSFYAAPEASGGLWDKTHYMLMNFIGEPKEAWEYLMYSIFTGKKITHGSSPAIIHPKKNRIDGNNF